jgi:hypothetical protein
MKIGKYQVTAQVDGRGVSIRVEPGVHIDDGGNVVSHDGPTFGAAAQLDVWQWGVWVSDGFARVNLAPFHVNFRDPALDRFGEIGASLDYDPDCIEPIGLHIRPPWRALGSVDVLAAVLGKAECAATEVERIEGVIVSGPEGFSARATATLEERRYTRSRWPGTWAVYRRVDFVFDEPADVPGFPRPLHDISIVAESIAQGLDKLHEKMFSR